MSGLKLSTIAASTLYTHPSKWARAIATAARPPNSISTERFSAMDKKGLRIAPSASSAHDKRSPPRNNNNNNDGIFSAFNSKNLTGFRFRGQNSLSSSSSSASKGGFSGSGLAADMDPDNSNINNINDKVEDDGDDWPHNDHGHLHRQNQPPPPSMQHLPNQHQSSKLLTLPTILTLGRVAAVPLLVCTFYVDSWWGRTATTSIFIAAAITDWLDGYIARKMRLGSAFGAFLDPVADKLMVAATLVLLCTRPLEFGMSGQVPWLLTVPSIAIIGREITMSAVREWAASQNSKLLEAVAVNNLGKWKTATQMTALIILLATRDSSLGGPGILVASGLVLLYISAGLSVWSLAVYTGRIWKVLLK